MSEQPLLIASTNRGKIAELSRLLDGLPVRVLGPDDLDAPVPDCPETGATFCENAAAKALHWRGRTGMACLADDSGLCVESLGGAPGIHSARYDGPGATDVRNVQRLLRLLEHVPDQKPGAAFVCCVALCRADGSVKTFEGQCRGYIVREPRGSGGFGYDPVFFYPPLGKTFAQLSPGEKNRVSHRARALQKLRRHLERYGL